MKEIPSHPSSLDQSVISSIKGRLKKPEIYADSYREDVKLLLSMLAEAHRDMNVLEELVATLKFEFAEKEIVALRDSMLTMN